MQLMQMQRTPQFLSGATIFRAISLVQRVARPLELRADSLSSCYVTQELIRGVATACQDYIDAAVSPI